MIRLRAIQNLTRKLFHPLSDIHYRLQYHPELSPAGWYLGRGMFIENYWLHEVMQNDDQFTVEQSLFLLDTCPLAQRGPRLPALKSQLDNILKQQNNNDILLMYISEALSQNALFKNEFIENYIIQNYALLYESIFMVLYQIALKKHNVHKKNHPYQPQIPLSSQALIKDISHIKSAKYSVGGEPLLSFDNELPAHTIQLDDFFIASTPVSNGQYLLFIEDNGYHNQALWSDAGWQWCQAHNIQHPEHWQQSLQQHWYGVNHQGPFDLNIHDAVYGLSFYEASAFANWAGARLPHEHEWEIAARLEVIKHTAQAWEWCSNIFCPYDGYAAFPEPASHSAKFDNTHYVLKGGSQHSRPEIKRAAFRNAYRPHQRHIFAGLRLVFT